MHNPLLTIGILGSCSVSNIEYNLNTYIGQSFQDFELIFCFDKKQCIPISSIIDSLNAHNFQIEGRVKILEDKDNSGLIANALKVIEEADGEYIFFVSLKDAFYDIAVTERIGTALVNHPAELLAFRTLINISGEWMIYPTDKKKMDCISICYPKNILLHWIPKQLLEKDNFYLFQQILLSDIAIAGYTINYIDENTVTHATEQKYEDLEHYYNDEVNQSQQLSCFLMSAIIPDINDLSKSHIKKILDIIKSFKLTSKTLADEIYQVNRLANESLWKLPDSIRQYLAVLQHLYIGMESNQTNKMKLVLLRQKLVCMLVRKKQKLLFLTHEYSVWPSLKSVYDEARKSNLYEVQLVYVPFFHEYSQQDHEREIMAYRQDGYPIIPCQEYDISSEYPDVVFYVKPYDSIPEKFQVKELRKIINTIVYIPYGMEIGNAKECLRYQCYGNMHYYANYILAYSPIYLEKMRHYTYTRGHNYLDIGHPRIDLKQDKSLAKNTYVTSIWKKASGRKVILWNTHFTITKGDNWGSFLEYGEAILDYFTKHSELFLLWRPHPLFYQALAESRLESLEKTKKWLYDLSNQENILLDDSVSYLEAFQASDAMISDWSSFVPEYAIYQKPLLVTPKNKDSSSIFSEAENVFCLSCCIDDIYDFLDAVQEGESDRDYIPDYSKILFMPPRKTVAKQLLNMLRHI